MLLFFFLHAVLFLYIAARLLWPARLSRPALALFAALLLAGSQHLFIRFLFGALSTPPVPPRAIMAEGWLYATSLLLFVLLVARDAFLLGQWLFRRAARTPAGDGQGGMDPARRAALFAVAAAVPMALAVRNGVALPEPRSMDAFFPDLPPGLDGLRIAQITDLHASDLFTPGWVRGVVERVNALKPDLVLLTGDLVDGTLERRRDAMERLGGLRAGIGVYACPGNHEYYAGYAVWTGFYRRLGITVLENRHAALTINGAGLAVAGVTDRAASGFGLPMPDPRKALAGAPQGAFRIMLKHRPGNAPASAAAGAHMLLAGHTHGGHVTGLDEIVAAFNSGYVHGWYAVGAMNMYVSSGAGLWNGFPVRLGVPSEIPHITLRRA